MTDNRDADVSLRSRVHATRASFYQGHGNTELAHTRHEDTLFPPTMHRRRRFVRPFAASRNFPVCRVCTLSAPQKRTINYAHRA